MIRLPVILNVINNKCCGTFQATSWIIFHFQGKDSTRAWLAKLSMHRRRNIYVFPILSNDRSNDTKWTIWLFMVEVYPVRNSTKDLFYNGMLWFPKHRQLCVSNSCYLDCESTGLKPVMDCKIPFIYIAETQRSRMIMSKTRSIGI
jgi:hypothetical protein